MSIKAKKYNKSLKRWARLAKSYEGNEGNENLGYDPDVTCNADCNNASDIGVDRVIDPASGYDETLVRR